MKTRLEMHRQDAPGDAGGVVVRLRLVTEPAGKPATADAKLLDALAGFCEQLRADPPAAVVVESDGPRFFLVGANLKVVQTLDAGSVGDWVRRGHAALAALSALPCPVIAAVRGHCLGGGVELALACDFVIADTTARFGCPEVGLGHVPGWGVTSRLPARVGLSFAKRMVLTGQAIDAAEASHAGLIDVLAEPEGFEEALDGVLAAMAAQSPVAVALSKELLDAARPGEPAEQLAAREAAASEKTLGHPDSVARLEAFFASRASSP